MRRNIVLVGFMGSGKSFVGQEIARLTRLAFVDLDSEIEKREKRSIPEIFEQDGENYFRRVETDITKYFGSSRSLLGKKSGLVISTGGGVIKSDTNIECLKKNGVLFFLDASIDEILKYTGNTTHRPLLNVEDPRQKIIDLLNERRAQYRKADYVIPTLERPAGIIAEEIIQIYNAREDMARVCVAVPDRHYDIVLGSESLSCLASEIRKIYNGPYVTVVSSKTVDRLYGKKVEEQLENYEFFVSRVVLGDGERYKNYESLQKIYDHLMHIPFGRDGLLVALGGGVIGDVAGFAAATFARGVPLIQVPTTLLAQVDSSVGGKVGINHPKGKNMIGAFYQPRLVFADTALLNTLDERQFIAGLAEVIKYGAIWDGGLFKFLEKKCDDILSKEKSSIIHIVKRSCEIKAHVVEKDEREANIRAILNFGHTFGHAIEACLKYKSIVHGEAVAIGMVMAADLSCRKGFLKPKGYHRLKNLIRKFGLPADLRDRSMDPEALLRIMRKDKKTRYGQLRFVLINKIGKAFITDDISEDEILAVCESALTS